MDVACLWVQIREHRWSTRRLKIIALLMKYAEQIDGTEYGHVTFNFGPSTVTPSINFVGPKERTDD